MQAHYVNQHTDVMASMAGKLKPEDDAWLAASKERFDAVLSLLRRRRLDSGRHTTGHPLASILHNKTGLLVLLAKQLLIKLAFGLAINGLRNTSQPR